MKFDNQLRYASHIVTQYNGQVPLSVFLKEFFRDNKQMGSRDRKTVSEMVYGYYRLGHNKFDSVEERLLASISISKNLAELNDYFFRDGNRPKQIDINAIFPYKTHLSTGVNEKEFSSSFLVQPDLFVRIRPGRADDVIKKLNDSGISFTMCAEDCVALPNSTKIESVFQVNREVVIQDKSSQATGEYIKLAATHLPVVPSVWDCCAASGGKSMLAFDILPQINLTSSDKRESIIQNLHSRMTEAGIENYRSFVADLANTKTPIALNEYDLVIADVPCSGSGTWARTPEQLYFFKEEKIDYYANLQKSIVSRILPSLKLNGMLLYITCSVFREENEEVVNYIMHNNAHLKLVKASSITGYKEKADTLFAALFINQSV